MVGANETSAHMYQGRWHHSPEHIIFSGLSVSDWQNLILAGMEEQYVWEPEDTEQPSATGEPSIIFTHSSEFWTLSYNFTQNIFV